MRYIEMNPVRAGMVDHPAKYRWSSYVANALGVSNAILSQHEEYIGLASIPIQRQKVYLGLFDTHLKADVLEFFCQSLQSGTPLGNEQFTSQVEIAIGQKVGHMKAGRPKKRTRKELTE